MAEKELTLSLPQIPKDAYYEDYVASILNAGGYYLERSVHRAENGIDLLELDVVATRFTASSVDSTIIEVKSGGWGMKDVFKVNGWLHFLDLTKAALIFQQREEDRGEEVFKRVAETLSVALLSNRINEDGRLENQEINTHFNIAIDDLSEHVTKAFRYSYDLERVMRDSVVRFIKDHPEYETPKKVLSYYRELIDTSFFVNDPIDRIHFVSDLFQRYRNIASIMEHELNNEGVKDADECVYFVNYYDLFFPREMRIYPVDMALLVTLLNKVYLIKSMVEQIVIPAALPEDKVPSFIQRLKYISLNSNITDGFDELKKHKYFYLYPYFFQVFFYVFGGFFMTAKKEEEYRLLSRITGVPVEEIDNAFAFWDILFHLPDSSWLREVNPHKGMIELKMVPAPLRGLGVNLRRHLYAPEGEIDNQKQFDNLSAIAGWNPFRDMLKWNNSAFAMLKQDVVLHHITEEGMTKSTKRLRSVLDYLNHTGKYVDIQAITDIAIQKSKPNYSTRGFVCKLDEEKYDLYIVKTDNRLVPHPMVKVVTDLGLNPVALQNCFVLGTDESIADDIDDTIWMTSRFDRSKLPLLEPILKTVEGVRK